MENAPVISVKNVNMTYPGKGAAEALKNVSLDIYKGDFVCVLGPSGCGKSTLLSIIAGLVSPTSGTVEADGKAVTGVDPNRAVMFQQSTLYPWLNVEKNVAFGPEMRGVGKKETKELVSKYLSLVGLSDFSSRQPYELSGGMKQRAALARVLVNQPEIILMDEPFGALDALTRLNMQYLIRKIKRETNSTVFFITHDVDEALSLANRVVVMSPGPGQIAFEYKIDFTNCPDEEFEDIKYKSDYIALRKEILSKINNMIL